MLIRWGQISLLALLAVVTMFVVGDVRDAVSQESDDSEVDAASTDEGFVAGTGRVESVETLNVRCEVSGGGTIVEMVADGVMVSEGDLIVRLDSSSLEDELDVLQIEVSQARAGVEQAQARLASQDVAAGSERETLSLRLEIAELELQMFQEGTLQLEIRKRESRIELAEQRFETWSDRVDRFEALVEGSGAGLDELESARLERQEARANLELARLEVEVLVQYEAPLQTKKLQLNVAQLNAALERLDRAGRASRLEAESQVVATVAALHEAEQRLSRVQEAIEKCVIHAPRDGIVVHPAIATRRATTTTLGVRATVREGQTVLQMPDLDRLRVRLNIREQGAEQVQVGQPVVLEFGHTEERLTGTVTSISERRDAAQFAGGFGQPPRMVLVELDGEPADVRIGMEARAVIDVSGSEDPDE